MASTIQTITDEKVQQPPVMLKRAVGNPSVGRFDKGVDFTLTVMSVNKTIKHEIENPGTAFTTETIRHGLGYRPYVTGTYDKTTIQDVKTTQQVSGGNVGTSMPIWVNDVTDQDVVLGLLPTGLIKKLDITLHLHNNVSI